MITANTFHGRLILALELKMVMHACPQNAEKRELNFTHNKNVNWCTFDCHLCQFCTPEKGICKYYLALGI